MRFISKVLFTIFLLSCFTLAQKTESPKQKLTKEFLSPTKQDSLQAEYENLEVFKILPRGMFSYENNALKLRGGGAYYSFKNKSHSYNKTPQIELQKNQLMVGFAGADYGFIADLGQVSFEAVKYTAEAEFLLKYQPPRFLKEIRVEQKKTRNYEINGLSFKRSVPAIVGNTYILRAISFYRADTMVSFKIHRQNSDGSLIIFWKSIKDFETPMMLHKTDEELRNEIESALLRKGLKNVTVSVKDNVVVLSGTVPRNKMGEAVMTAAEAKPKKVENQLSYERKN